MLILQDYERSEFLFIVEKCKWTSYRKLSWILVLESPLRSATFPRPFASTLIDAERVELGYVVSHSIVGAELCSAVIGASPHRR